MNQEILQQVMETPEVLRADFGVSLLVAVIVAVVSTVLSELLRPKPDIENAKPAGKGDFRFPTAEEGRKIPLIWGQVRLSGPNVTWWGDFKQIPIKEKIKTGLWSKKRIIVGFRYFVGIDMALCRGNGTDVTLHQVWVGDKFLPGAHTGDIDEGNFFGGSKYGNGGIQGTTEFFPGSTTQLASTYLSTFQDPITAQRGTAHLVFEGGWIGDSTNIKPWAFECSRFPNALFTAADAAGVAGTYTNAKRIVNSSDLNIAEFIYEVLTNEEWGMFRTSAQIDLENFAEVASTTFDEGNGFAMQLEREVPASELLNLAQEQADCVVYQDRSTGKFKIRLARQDYVPTITTSSISASSVYAVASNGDTFTPGQTIYAVGHTNPENNGRKTVDSVTPTSVTVTETLVDETSPTGAFISELNGIDDSNFIEVRSFKRQTWHNTVNEVRVKYTDRDKGYFDTSAMADNLANKRAQNGNIVIATINYPGCKNATLANALAARGLRFHSYPLATCQIMVNRDFFDVVPGQVVRWTNTFLDITNLAFRVTRVDFQENGAILLTMIQDIFTLETGFFGDPQNTLWQLPEQDTQQIPVDEHQVFEAPRAIVDRDPLFPDRKYRVFVGARAQAGEVAIRIYTRTDSVTPIVGDYELDGENQGLFQIGLLNTTLTVGDANPTTSFQLQGSPDLKVDVINQFDPDGATAAEVGEDLANIIKIGDEFIGVRDIQDDGGNLYSFTTCYRGLLDSVPEDHAINDKVYLLYEAGGMNDKLLVVDDYIDIQPRTESRDGELLAVDAQTFSFQVSQRYDRPYPPYRLDINSSRFPTAPSMDSSITNPGADARGFKADWFRRDYNTTDEVASVLNDAVNIDSGFQAVNSHECRLTLNLIDRDSLSLQVYQGAWQTSLRTDSVSRAEVLGMADGDIRDVEFSVLARHTVDSVVYEARNTLDFTTSPASAELSGLTNLGTVFAGDNTTGVDGPVSRLYTCASAVTHDLTVGTSITGVQYRLNGGSWTAIASLSGETIAVNDTLEFRHQDNGGSPTNTVAILDEDGTDVAYLVFNTDPDMEGLVGYWTFNEVAAGATLAVDREARFGRAPAFEVDGVGVPSVTGKFLRAVDFDGVSYLRIDTADIDIELFQGGVGDLSVAFFAKVDAASTSDRAAVAVGNGDNGSNSMFHIRANASTSSPASRWRMHVINDLGFQFAQAPSAGTIDFGEWELVCMTIDVSASTATIYVVNDAGTESGSINFVTNGLVSPATSGRDFTVGSDDDDTSPGTGIIVDDLRVYKRVLSQSEIEALFNRTAQLPA